MRLSTLAIRHFRNLGNQDLELPPEGVALIGDNAQGKSNFLEAIYYLETFRSFRGARDAQLLAFGQNVFRVVGTTSGGSRDTDAGEVAAAFERKGKRKKVTVDGSEPGRMGDALGRLAAVIFSPSDIELVSGGPKERRRFLDIVLSLNEPAYLGALQDYRRVLSHRNAALKGGHGAAAVGAWNEGLVAAGARIMWARKEWVEQGSDVFSAYYGRVSDEGRALMSYKPSVAMVDASHVAAAEEAFRAALAESCERDRRLGTTTVGPHRDDLRIQLDGGREQLDLRDYGSGGQRRTAALALRLVEAQTIRARRRQTPLILLDDVFAELDVGRSERVMALMEAEDTGQVVLTAPKEADVRIRRDALARWRIRGGRITA